MANKEEGIVVDLAGDEEPAEKKKRVPRVRTGSRGKISQTLDMLGEMYKKDNPEREIRWVYHPEHRPDLSNVITRRAQGYVEVYVEDLGDTVLGLKSGEVVRVGDLILMSCPTEVKEELREEIAERAREQASSVQREFYDSIDQVAKPGGAEMRARGKAAIEEREASYDIEQRTS